MNDNTRKSDDSHIRKYGTRIDGLDRLLYGGIDLQTPLTVVAVTGNDETERSLLGLQILYGVGQSLYKVLQNSPDTQKKDLHIHHMSSDSNGKRAEKHLLNVIISSNVRQLMEMYVSTPAHERDRITNVMSSIFFEDNIEIGNPAFDEIANNRLVNMVKERTDYLLGKEVLYYSNRTCGIHLRSAKGCQDLDADSDEENLLFRRRFKTIKEYFEEKDLTEKILKYNKYFPAPFINVDFEELPGCNDLTEILPPHTNGESIVAINLTEKDSMQISEYERIIYNLKKEDNVRLLLLILPDQNTLPDHLVDMRIEMKNVWNDTYLYKYIGIEKSRIQNRVLGLHQYKQKDYGIEVYPSVHTYYEQRRYLQRALIFTHSDVITETYQQYIDEKRNRPNEKTGYKDYIDNKKKQAQDKYLALYPKYDQGMSSVDVLDRIMLSQKDLYKDSSRNVLDEPLFYLGCVTAVIGEPNSYKRFLTFGSIFSSSQNKEHTLVLLMNKDYTAIRRQLFCPARAERKDDDMMCMKCYGYIHFMNMSMGNVKPEEFIYYLNRQLDTCYDDGKKIKRVVLDDLQIVDFCFPELSKQDNMFLPTLVSVCKERGIWLYVMCDKDSKSVGALRALSDNVICTDKGKDGQLIVHIERYVGYHNTPSMIRSCYVKKAKHLFECYEKINDDDESVRYFELNNQQIISKSEPTLRQYWNSNQDL